MFATIEISDFELVKIRITALELMFRDTYKTINYANKILLEIELGKAYNQLNKLHENEKTNIKIYKKPRF